MKTSEATAFIIVTQLAGCDGEEGKLTLWTLLFYHSWLMFQIIQENKDVFKIISFVWILLARQRRDYCSYYEQQKSVVHDTYMHLITGD